jgi:hypothetical protein
MALQFGDSNNMGVTQLAGPERPPTLYRAGHREIQNSVLAPAQSETLLSGCVAGFGMISAHTGDCPICPTTQFQTVPPPNKTMSCAQ